MNTHGKPRTPEIVLKSVATMRQVAYRSNCVWKKTCSVGSDNDVDQGLTASHAATRMTTGIGARFACAATTFTAWKKLSDETLEVKTWKRTITWNPMMGDGLHWYATSQSCHFLRVLSWDLARCMHLTTTSRWKSKGVAGFSEAVGSPSFPV